jgi:hypothetical protein
LSELSGLATGRLNPDLLWAHNDSGGAATVYGIGPEGADAGSYPLDGASNRDWEDMAAWQDPDTGVDWLYIGDIGDNLAQWESVFVYRVPEPVVDATKAEGHVLVGVETFELTYPDGPHDAETLLVDPATGTITIVTKNRGGPGQVFVATDAVAGARSELVEFGLLDLSTTLDGVATAGDHADAFVLIRTYLAVLAYPTTEGEWWLADPCPLDAPFEIQGEAVAAESTAAYWTAPEGSSPTITRSEFG